jgi:hypothetical protein
VLSAFLNALISFIKGCALQLKNIKKANTKVAIFFDVIFILNFF